MTALDPTRPRSGDAPPEHHDELVDGGDPYHCPACVADGVECEFHRGWAAGWDACAAFVAQAVEDHRSAELDPAPPVDDGGGVLHDGPCGCRWRQVDVPDDQWIGQRWDLVRRCSAHAPVSASATSAGLGGPLWVVCADEVCRHAEPFDEFVHADDFACSEHEGCGGSPHSIVTEPAGLGIATSEPGDRPRGGTGGW